MRIHHFYKKKLSFQFFYRMILAGHETGNFNFFINSLSIIYKGVC